MRLRQIALVAQDLEPVVESLCAVLDLEVCFRDPGVAEFGLHNALMPIGTSFLEVVSPTRAGTTAGRLLERHGGDGGYMVIAQTDDLEADRKRMAELGVRVVWQVKLSDAETIHLHPRDVGGAIVSLDVSEPAAGWAWAGPEWERHVRRGVATGLAGLELTAPDPAALAARWGALLGRPPRAAGDGAHQIALDGAVLRFASGAEEGIAAVGVRAADPERAGATCTVAGTAIHLVA